MTENNYHHPADEILEASVESVMNAEGSKEAVEILGTLAGGIENAFLNLVNNTSEKAVRLVILKVLIEFWEAGDYDSVMTVMGFAAEASNKFDPGQVERFRQDQRDLYDQMLGDTDGGR